jgi:2-polyprenyl-3-methyl-5-hydroxy-6-metoxy-1,4-benzoquinol methylase
MNTAHYETKDQEYFSNVRLDIISLIPSNPQQRLLEIGAGGGNTLLYIKEHHLAAEVMGIELMEIPGSNQQHQLIDKFQVANIEHQEIDASEEYFDVIVCADVLEHLVDPWGTVRKLERYLKKGGVLIASLPNVREWKTLSRIVFKGNFAYDPAGGIMDKTHLRFFCKKNILQLFKTSSLTPVYSRPNFMLKEVPQGKKRRILNRFTFGLFENFLAVQYLVIAKKN